jgi:hypothetical protein
MVSKDPKMSKQGTADKRKYVTKHWINFVQYKEMEQPNTIMYGIKWKCAWLFQARDTEIA